MKNGFQNKKVVIIAIIMAIVIIALAIVLFTFMGANGKNKKSEENNTIKFGEDNTSNKTENKTNNEIENEVDNKTENKIDNKVSSSDDDDDEIGADIEQYYKIAAKKFAKGFMDEDDMKDFLENCVDVKAYVAYDNLDGDESKFEDEYNAIENDDSRIQKIETAFAEIPETYKDTLDSIDQITAGNNVSNDLEITDFTEEDKLIVLKDIDKPIKSTSNSRITSIEITYTWMKEDEKITMVFFDDVVIFICDDEGTAITGETI